jgi:predicted glycosyltransferase
LSEIPEINWQVFSKHTQVTIERKNITVYPISNDLFVQSLINCTGVLCGAGFETPAEALFLNKKLMVIPMKRQYEQQCNAAALANMGVPVIKSLKMKHLDTIEDWVYSKHTVQVEYPDTTEQIIDTLLANHLHDTLPETLSFAESVNSVKQLKELILANILKKATSAKY